MDFQHIHDRFIIIALSTFQNTRERERERERRESSRKFFLILRIMAKKKNSKKKRRKKKKSHNQSGQIVIPKDALNLSDGRAADYVFEKGSKNCKRSLRILGSSIVLEPYDMCHVSKVNTWLKDDWIREVVSAKKLSLEKEYEQQKTWAKDETKHSFIVCRRKAGRKNQPIGTVDLFIDTGEYAEIIIMIADRQHRRKGLAREAVCLALRFGFEILKMTRFVAKIMDSNTASLTFFRNMSFEMYEHDEDFDMTHLHRHITKEISDSLLKEESFVWLCSSEAQKQQEPMNTSMYLTWIGSLLSRRNKYDCKTSIILLLCSSYFSLRLEEKSNNNMVIRGKKVTLVPYSPWHVETYHEWMKDPYILKMTASESLSMEQEYSMQKTWNEDPTKLTFIVMDSSSLCYNNNNNNNVDNVKKISRREFNEEVREVMEEYEIEDLENGIEETAKQYEEREREDNIRYDLIDLAIETSSTSPHARYLLRESTRKSEENAMAGDVNMFLLQKDSLVAELSVMIVPKRFRRRGLATESLKLMMRHAMLRLGITTFVAKISKDNESSIKLFQEKLGFQCIYECDVFNEVHFCCDNLRSLEKVLDVSVASSCSLYSDHLRQLVVVSKR